MSGILIFTEFREQKKDPVKTGDNVNIMLPIAGIINKLNMSIIEDY